MGEPSGWLVYSPGPANPSTYRTGWPTLLWPRIDSHAFKYAFRMAIFASVCAFAAHVLPCTFDGIVPAPFGSAPLADPDVTLTYSAIPLVRPLMPLLIAH